MITTTRNLKPVFFTGMPAYQWDTGMFIVGNLDAPEQIVCGSAARIEFAGIEFPGVTVLHREDLQ